MSAGARAPQLPLFDFTIGATALGGFFCERAFTALVRPPELRITPAEATLRYWRMLGLRSVEIRIPANRITSVSLTTGILWAAISVETAGASSDFELAGLKKKEARDMMLLLRKHVLQEAGSETAVEAILSSAEVG